MKKRLTFLFVILAFSLKMCYGVSGNVYLFSLRYNDKVNLSIFYYNTTDLKAIKAFGSAKKVSVLYLYI